MANGVINVLFNVCECSGSDGSIIRTFGRTYCSITCIATADQLITAWNSIDRYSTPDVIAATISPYFSVVRVPSVNPGGSLELNPSGAYYNELSAFCLTKIFSATFSSNGHIAIVDNNGNGFYNFSGSGAGLAGPRFKLDGNFLSIGEGIYTHQFGLATNAAWGTSLVFPFRTADNRLGCLDIYYNKGNSHLGFANAADSALISNFLDGITPDNPYEPGGISGPGGGDGTFISVDDSIDFPTLPILGALNAGFVSIWTPTLAQVQKLAAYMWTTDITKSGFWKNLVQSPLELIFSLSIMPIAEGTPGTELRLGWINTGIWTNYRESQYYEVDCGSIDMKEYWGAFFDYEPYTKVSIYLPYIGVKELSTNDIMGRVVALKYNIDLATGACVAMIKCDDAVYYHFVGSCAVQIPITAANMQEVVKGVVQAAVGAASFVAAPALASTTTAVTAARAGAAAAGFGGLYKAVTGHTTERSSNFTGNSGFMSVQTPYLIISRPRQAMPEDQQVYTGFPAFMTKRLSDVSGYTEVQMIHLHNLSCTDDERAEIDELLKEGVIF